MNDPLIPDVAETEEAQAATKAAVFGAPPSGCSPCTASRTSRCATSPQRRRQPGKRQLPLRSKDALRFAIFRKRTGELNSDGARMLHEPRAAWRQAAGARDPGGAVRARRCAGAIRPTTGDSMQFIIRARSEGTAEMRDAPAERRSRTSNGSPTR